MLTTKESEIALLVSQGLTNNEIATRLCLAPGTIRNHVSVCLQKLCLTNRAQLTAWAIRNKIENTISREPVDPDTYKDLIYGIYA